MHIQIGCGALTKNRAQSSFSQFSIFGLKIKLKHTAQRQRRTVNAQSDHKETNRIQKKTTKRQATNQQPSEH